MTESDQTAQRKEHAIDSRVISPDCGDILAAVEPQRYAVRSQGGRYVGTCAPCRKRSYATRKSAKAMIKLHCDAGMRAYPCPTGSGYYHIGHPSAAEGKAVVGMDG